MSRNTVVIWYWRQNQHDRRQTWRSAILFNTNSTWNCPSNPEFRGESSATDRLCPRHGHTIRMFVEVFFLLSYSSSSSYHVFFFCLVAFRSDCFNIPIITCAMSVVERKCRARCGAGIRLPENVREQQWPATDTTDSQCCNFIPVLMTSDFTIPQLRRYNLSFIVDYFLHLS